MEMTEFNQPQTPTGINNAGVPNFIANNPESLAAYMAGIARADLFLEHPEAQSLPPQSAQHEAGNTIARRELPAVGRAVVEAAHNMNGPAVITQGEALPVMNPRDKALNARDYSANKDSRDLRGRIAAAKARRTTI